MLLLRQNTILHGRPVERFQIRIHTCSLGRELSPEIVCLSIIVYKDIGVNLFRSLYLYTITERTDRRITRCHVFLTIRNVIIQIVTTVFIDGIRSVQCFLPLERLAMQRPVLQIIRGKNMISFRAIGAWNRISRTIDIKLPILPDTSCRVGNIDSHGGNRILCCYPQRQQHQDSEQ